MSVINQVLKDLDRTGNAAEVPPGVRPVPPARRRRRALLRTAVILLAAGAVAGGVWFVVQAPPPLPAAPKAAAKPPPQAALPVPAAPVPTVAPQPAQESSPTAQASPAAAAPEPPRAVAQPVQPQPPAAQVEAPRAETPRKVVAAKPRTTETAAVVKEVRPATPQEQAEQTYRQALRAAERGQATEARRLLQTALDADPAHLSARQTLVALLLEAGDPNRAETLLREGTTLHTGDPWFHKGLGQLSLQHGDYAQAADWLSDGLARAGADAGYWGLAAGVLAKAGRSREALAAYREAVRLQPAHGPWWIGLGLALEGSGERAEAAAAFRRAGQTPLSTELRDFVEQKLAALAK